jgi:transcriptional regulator with XRE-family HTH domain
LNLNDQLSQTRRQLQRLQLAAEKERQPRPGTLGGTICALRKQRRMKLVHLARASGVSSTVLSRLETGGATNPTLEILLGIAQGLAMPLSALLREWEEAPPASAPVLTDKP